MPKTNRRSMLRVGLAFVALPSTILHLGCVPDQDSKPRNMEGSPDDHATVNDEKPGPTDEGKPMQIQYVEIVTPEVDAVCATYSKLHGVTFGDADHDLGGARTAILANGGLLGVRAPLRDKEKPVVRPYLLVEDIKASVTVAADSGAKIALPPTEVAGHGTCAIVIQGGVESGLWQL